MTVQIILMNKSGLVAASDRTIIDTNRNQKIHHKQQKIFPLDPAYKATIMFNNNTQLNGVPWEIVIHHYQKHLHQEHPNLSDTDAILAHFLDFLKCQNTLFPIAEQNRYAAYDLLLFFKNFNTRRYLKWQEQAMTLPFIDYLSQSLYGFFLDKEYQIQQTQKTFLQYQQVINGISNKQLSDVTGIPIITAPLRRAIDHIMQYLLFQEGLIHENSEIIIAGYGMDMIFPAVSAAYIGGNYCGQLHHKKQQSQKISHNNQAQIIPFAQSQYINESLKGLSNENEDFLLNLFYDALSNFRTNDPISMDTQGLNNFDKTVYFEDFRLKLSQHLRDQHISPMIQAIKHMPEDDMAKIAHTFLQISQFKQNLARLSFETPSVIDYITINHHQGHAAHVGETAQVDEHTTSEPIPR